MASFFEKLITVGLRDFYRNKLHFVRDHNFDILCRFGFRVLIHSEDMVKQAIM